MKKRDKKKSHINFLILPKHLLTLALCVGLTLSSQSSLSQEINTDKRWYKVELIIFRQGGNPKQHVEQWGTNVKLSYPLEWTTLVGQEQESTIVPEGSIILLPESELTLQDKARKLQRSNNYRILFHGAWNQDMIERADSPAILIEGGELFGDHRELQGSIQLKLQRYLHITTNLWLINFATNFGQETLNWPEIPIAPNKPQKRITTFTADRGGNVWSQFESSNNEYDDLISSPYIVENIAPIKVTRRMRSKELHYIDHPLAGILIEFTPIDVASDPQEENEEVREEESNED
ncbi:MAG: peptidoglycan binding protein CsiV [Cellvibrionaceae bacterium]